MSKAAIVVVLMLFSTHTFAVTKTFNVTSGNWNTGGNWSPSGVPLAADDVIIPSARAVTVDVAAVCATLSFSATANSASSVTISGSNSLTVTGAITYVDPTGGSGDQTIAVGTGTLTCGSLVFANSSGGTEDNIFTVSTGIVNVNGNITFNGATNENSFTFSGAATLNITGTITGGGTFTVDVANATVNFNGAAQNIPARTFRNATMSGTGDKTAVGNFNVNGILTINSGRILNMSTFTLGGTPTSTSGTGTLQTASTSATPLPSGVTWTFPTVLYNSGSAQTIVAGTYIDLNGTGGNRTLINGGTINLSGVFTPGSGTYTVTGNTMNFNGAAQNIPVFTYNSLTISGTGDKTVAGTINVNGVLTISTGRILNMGASLLGGNPSSTSGTGTLQTQNTANPAIPTSETWAPVVEFNGAAQTVEAGTYTGGIIVSGSGDKTGEAITINGILTMNSGRILNMGTNTMGGNPTSISGTGTLQTASTAGTPIPSGETWTGTVQYNSASAQTIVAGNYIDLNGTGGNRTLVNGGTIGVSGVFTPGAGTYTVTGNTMDFNGAAQNIPAFTYNSLTISGTGDKTAAGTINVNGVLTINTSRILNMGTNLLGGNPTSTSGTGTLQTANTANPAIPSGETWAPVVEFNGAAQTVEAGTYTGGIIVSGSGDKTGEAITINGILTINSGRILNMGTNTLSGNPTTMSGTGTLQTASTGGTPIPSGETWTGLVQYNSASAQTIVAGTYTDLNGTGGNRTLINGGTINVSGVFTPGAGAYTVTNNTFNFSGAAQDVPALTYNSLTISGTGDKTATGTVNVNGVLTINSGRILSMGTNLLGGNPSSTSGTGTLQTQNTANPAIPTGETWTFTVEYNGAAQTVESGTYTNLTCSGTGDKTGEASISVSNIITINAGRILNMGTNTLGGAIGSTSGTGTLQTQSTANPAIPSNEIWSFLVEYNGAAQTLEAGTYNGGLTASGSGNKTGEAISVSGVFTINSGRTVNMGTNLLSGDPTSTSGTGLLQTQNTANPAIPTGETWTFTVEYNGAAQTIEAGTYNGGLTCSGSGNKTGEAISVSGVLTIDASRILNMGTNALGGSITSTSGTGTLQTANTSATPIPGDVVWTFGVTYNSASAQTIVAGTYPTLTASGGARTFSSTSVIIISGTFTPGAGNYTIGTSTVRYTTSTASLPIPTVASGGNYYNLEISSGTWNMPSALIVSNNFTVNGGTFNVNNATSNVMTVNGNVTVSSGKLDLNVGASGTSTLNVRGNLAVTGTGSTTTEGTGAPNGTINFNGTGTLGSPQTISYINPTNNIYVNFAVASGTVLQLSSNVGLSIWPSSDFYAIMTVNSGGTLNMQGFSFVDETSFSATGNNTVVVNSGASVVTSHALGIPGNLSSTNTIRSLSSAANYEFRGAITGAFTTTPTANTVNNLTVNNASGVTLSQAFTVNGALGFTTGSLVVGNSLLTINGTLTGTTSFTGSSTSTINITGTGAIGSTINMNTTSNTTRSLNNLTVNRTSSTITLGNELRLIGTLTLSNGTLASAGNLRLVSDASGTARIATLAGTGAITGNVIAERFIPSSARRFRFMSSNITNGTIEDWRGETFITGTGTGNTVGATNSNGFDATSTNNSSIFHYNEPTTGSSSLGWTAATNTSNSLVVGRGYRVFVRGDRSTLNRLNETDLTQNAVTLNLVGPVNTGNIAMPVSYTNTLNVSNDGWNLLGNPYPSQFDWNAFWDAGNSGDDGTNYTNIEAVISVFDASTNSYKSYNASSNTGTFNGILAQGQGFFSKSTGSGTALTFTEAFKVSGTPTQMFKSATTSTDELHIKLIADSINIDEMIVKFIAGATKNADGFDIEKRVNPRANVASKVLNGVLLTVDARPELTTDDTIVVAIGTSAGNYTFEFNQLPVMPGKYLYLRDEFLNTTIGLTLNLSVPFTVTSVPASYANDRFKIIVSGNSALPVSFANLWAEQADENVTLNWVTYNEVNVSHFNLLSSTNGIDFSEVTKVKAQGAPNRTTKYAFVDSDNDLSVGRYYKVRIVDIDGAIDETNTVFVSKDNKITVADQLLCYPNPADAYTHISSEKIMAGDEVVINYLDASGKTNEITLNAIEDGVIKVTTAQLADGLYFFVLSTNKETIGTANVLVQH